MNNGRRILILAASGLSTTIVLGACASKKTNYFPAALEISATGDYKVNGVAVARSGLKTALLASKQADGKLDVHFKPEPSAPIESVQFAMTVVQELGGRIGLVGNVRY